VFGDSGCRITANVQMRPIFEGQCNELAAHGYNRDGERYKKQVVAGLLTDASSEPLSIQLYPGNTSDPKTFQPTVEKLKVCFGAKAIVLVGDRGMIKKMGKTALGAAGYRYVPDLTNPQIRKLLAKKVLSPEFFDEEPAAERRSAAGIPRRHTGACPRRGVSVCRA